MNLQEAIGHLDAIRTACEKNGWLAATYIKWIAYATRSLRIRQAKEEAAK